jgi:glycosyltransferase involved in cell wall biosynthesis
MKRLKGSSDCLISLHRSEGYGLNLLEFLMLGKPVVATAYSGSLEFMQYLQQKPEFEHLLVPYSLTTVKKTWGDYPKGKLWADPDLDQAAKSMAFLAQKMLDGERVYYEKFAKFVQREMAAHFSLEVAGANIQSHLGRISATYRQ